LAASEPEPVRSVSLSVGEYELASERIVEQKLSHFFLRFWCGWLATPSEIEDVIHRESGAAIDMPTAACSEPNMLSYTSTISLRLRIIKAGNWQPEFLGFLSDPCGAILEHIVVVIHPRITGPTREPAQLQCYRIIVVIRLCPGSISARHILAYFAELIVGPDVGRYLVVIVLEEMPQILNRSRTFSGMQYDEPNLRH
jgi:hypothetical protein